MTLYAETKPREEAQYQHRGFLSRLAQAEIQRQQRRKQITRKEQK